MSTLSKKISRLSFDDRVLVEKLVDALRGTKRKASALTLESSEDEEEVVREHLRELHRKMSLASAIDKYTDDMTRRGLKAKHVTTTRYRLLSLVQGELDLPVSELTVRRATALYNTLAQKVAVDTHRNTLNQARTWCKWLVKKQWMDSNPFAEVEGVGRRSRGKKQLTIDESRRLVAWCLERPADIGATATLVCLLLGLRSGEISGLRLRSLDDRGRLVRIGGDVKTKASVRLVEVPEVLRPRMRRLVGESFDRHWVSYHVRRCCREAGVTVVGPHALRGTHASLATQAGASSQLVASTLGHASTAVTEAHYTSPTALAQRGQNKAVSALVETVTQTVTH